MRTLACWLYGLAPIALICTVALSGCGKKDEEGEAGAPPKKKTQAKAAPAKVDGYATSLKGKVTYNGPEAAMTVNVQKPSKDADKCPMEIKTEGWYVKDKSAKGVQYAVVYLKVPKGLKVAPELEKAPSPTLDVKQPRCQFEPRVLVLHPAQSIKVFNDSEPPIPHDAKFSGPADVGKTMPPNSDAVFDLDSNNGQPWKMSCGIHQGTMSAYVWKFDHPYAVVTDETGAFELKHLPVIAGGKLEVWVWHEMLPDKMKKIGTMDVEVGKSGTLDIAIPN